MTATQINLSERSENVAISKKKGLHLNLYLISWFSSPKSSVLLKKKIGLHLKSDSDFSS